MKVLHVPFSFHPDAVGGTEVYVENLARQQLLDGIEARVAAPAPESTAYTHNGLQVSRFRMSTGPVPLRELYGEGDAVAAESFSAVLDAWHADIVHVHGFTYAISLRLVREATRRAIPVVFSYHTPTATCQRGTLFRWGAELCDGVLDTRRCTACTLHGLGLSKPVSEALSLLPRAVGRRLGAAGLTGGSWTAIRMTDLVSLRHEAVRSLMRETDAVIALCDWVKDVLLRNGVPATKITLSRQGLDPAVLREVGSPHIERRDGPLRVIFLGRLDYAKGVHVLVEALRGAPELSLTLDVFGIAQGESGRKYLARLRDIAGGDPRISFFDPIPPSAAVAQIREYDVLAAPSQWLETGPMVVMEAFAAGVPVIGSNLGGISELVTDERDGLLVEPTSVDAWRAALRRVAEDRRLLNTFRSHIQRPRSIADVAMDMSGVYARVIPRAALAVTSEANTLSA